MSKELTRALMRYTQRHPGNNVFKTTIGELGILRSDHPRPPTHRVAMPSICMVAQGAKWATFGGQRLTYQAGEALVVGIATPSMGRVVQASPERPCLVLVLELDLALMRGVAEELEAPPAPAPDVTRSVFVVDIRGPMLDCALRVVRLLDTPEAMPTLYPMIMREICYWLLAGPHGGDFMRMGLVDSPSQRVIAAVHSLRQRFAEPVRLDELAAIARMGASAFHRRFKALTALTPLQYQKQMRLLEARRLMIADALNAEAAAFAVGYESPSQFSREYSRMFGTPPKRNVRRSARGGAGADA